MFIRLLFNNAIYFSILLLHWKDAIPNSITKKVIVFG